MENKQNNDERRNFKQIFNLNNILSQAITYAAYLISIGSAIVLIYISLIQTFKFEIDWTTVGIFSAATVLLAWLNWSTWYRKHYEKTMSEDIKQHSLGKYSIHGRYYHASKDFTDAELQLKIDEFNDEYTDKWLRYVERVTGKPIETKTEIELDKDGNPVLDESTGEPKIIITKGIKDLPYRGFKHPILMWRIKNHRYPQSGYKTSMELMSLLSFQESNLNKRHLRAHTAFYVKQSISKFLTSLLTITVSASIIPEFITGQWGSAILKLIVALGALGASILTGAMNGIRGARLKLSTVEGVCIDLEEWGHKKPIIAPYNIVDFQAQNNQVQDNQEKVIELKSNEGYSSLEVTNEIFNIQNSQNK